MMRGLMVSSHAADTGYSDLYATAVTSLAYCRHTASIYPINRVAYTQKLIDKLVGIPSIRVGGVY